MMGVVLATAWRQGLLNFVRLGALAARPIWRCGLFVNDLAPTPDNLAGDFSPPHWPGYALLPLTLWGVPYLRSDGDAEMQHQALTFRQATPADPPDDVYGYLVVDGLGRLVWSERLPDSPTTMALPGQEFIVQPRLFLGAIEP